jgi:hypothetical protein
MKKLKEHFSKNGLEYTLLKRNDKVALFILGLLELPDGYEVCRIYVMKPHRAFGVEFEESEKISSNDQFYRDGSGSFRSLDNALKHYDVLTRSLLRDENVNARNVPEAKVIVEYQPVVDNGS